MNNEIVTVIGFHLSPSFLENLEAGFVFWIFDVIILVVLLPSVLDRIQRRKWRPMRREIVLLFLDLLEKVVLFCRLDSFSLAEAPNEIEEAEKELRSNFDLFTVALTPEMSMWVMRYFDQLKALKFTLSQIAGTADGAMGVGRVSLGLKLDKSALSGDPRVPTAKQHPTELIALRRMLDETEAPLKEMRASILAMAKHVRCDVSSMIREERIEKIPGYLEHGFFKVLRQHFDQAPEHRRGLRTYMDLPFDYKPPDGAADLRTINDILLPDGPPFRKSDFTFVVREHPPEEVLGNVRSIKGVDDVSLVEHAVVVAYSVEDRLAENALWSEIRRILYGLWPGEDEPPYLCE